MLLVQIKKKNKNKKQKTTHADFEIYGKADFEVLGLKFYTAP